VFALSHKFSGPFDKVLSSLIFLRSQFRRPCFYGGFEGSFGIGKLRVGLCASEYVKSNNQSSNNYKTNPPLLFI
jgi:hypothetical protein